METWESYNAARAVLAWQVELGADEAICDAPIDRYVAPPPTIRAAVAAAPTAPPHADVAGDARRAAAAAQDLDGLRAAMAAFEGCDLKRGARKLVFSDGDPTARLMIVGEAPGRDDDRSGQPFTGPAGQLLDRMLAAIGLERRMPGHVYLTHVLPWRPPQDRDPTPDEIATMLPFLERHIALAEPDVLVLFGNTSVQALLGRRGISRMRGQWAKVGTRPALPMLSPGNLLKNPVLKRDAWNDLLSLKARLA